MDTARLRRRPRSWISWMRSRRVGFEFALRGRAKEADKALEFASPGSGRCYSGDNGLIFTSRRFREGGRLYRLAQEFIAP